MSIDFDRRLEPDVRRRTQAEIEDILKDEYQKFLDEVTLSELIARVNPKDIEEVAELCKEKIYERDAFGYRDKEFQKTIDQAALIYDEEYR